MAIEDYWEYSFDLEVSKLKKYYGKASYENAYQEIGKYLIAHGFDNKDEKQGSCYFTSKRMSEHKADRTVKKMYQELVWLPFCIRRSVLTIKTPAIESYDTYANYLRKSKSQLKKLDDYYKDLGIKNPFHERTQTRTR